MFVTKKCIPRRSLLRGLGVSVALPLLDAMLPAATALADSPLNPRTRMGFFYFPHGAFTGTWTSVNTWTPVGEGRDFTMSPILKPLQPFRDRMTVVSGLRNRAQEAPMAHQAAEETWLTAVHPSAPRGRGAGTADVGISIDQLAAREIGQETAFASLEFATEPNASYGGYSLRVPGRRLPLEYNPRKVFERLFGPGDSLEERESILAGTGSVLDRIQAEARQFQKALGAADRVRLSEYLGSVREVERQLQNMLTQDFAGVEVPTAPVGIPDDFVEHMQLMFDLLALAYQADLTRITSLRLAAELTLRAYTNLGISEAFHPLSHHGNRADNIDKLIAIQTFHSDMFARFLAKLDAIPEADGASLLDHSVMLYGSGMSDSDLHNSRPLPLAVFGHAGSRIKGGQHLVYPEDTPYANLLVTLLDRAGVPVESVGDSTGDLSEL